MREPLIVRQPLHDLVDGASRVPAVLVEVALVGGVGGRAGDGGARGVGLLVDRRAGRGQVHGGGDEVEEHAGLDQQREHREEERYEHACDGLARLADDGDGCADALDQCDDQQEDYEEHHPRDYAC